MWHFLCELELIILLFCLNVANLSSHDNSCITCSYCGGGSSELSNIFILPSKLIILWLLFKVIESQMKSWTLGFLSNSNKIRSFHQNSYLAPIFWGIIFWVAWILPDVITTLRDVMTIQRDVIIYVSSQLLI